MTDWRREASGEAVSRKAGQSVLAAPNTTNHRPVAIATAIAIALSLAYLLAPKMGGDLSAQIARADFARHHPFTPVDFRWFGGTLPFGYSLWTPPVMALLGVRITGALATVLAVGLFTRVIEASGARRPLWGGIAAAITLTSNLAEGRITFACGVAFGLAALNLLARHRALAVTAAVVAGGASPVAALLLIVCAIALLSRRRLADAATLAACAIPVALIAGLFSDGGTQVFNGHDAIRAFLASALLIAFVAARYRVLAIGGAVGLVMVALAFLLPTPIGSNSTRLSLLFAVPLVAAFASFEWWLAAIAVVIAVVVQTPVTLGTLTGAGKPVTGAAYFQPLADELKRRGPLSGRVEIPELTGHWDAAYLARSVPLARGWLRQTDTKLNDNVFYKHLPTPASYRQFLDRNAVEFVAVADARPTYYGRRETTLISTGMPYLHKVWSDKHWSLYSVTDPTPVVSAPAELVSYSADNVVVRAPANAEIPLKLRWFRWLSVDQGCLHNSDDQIVLRTTGAGNYTISSTLRGGSQC
ncbi:MAG: hypothetical protein JWM76_430 [Pseudonocardiales bacterium]|nr:hypothetical protein [Pseudonocardiales bacterium]